MCSLAESVGTSPSRPLNGDIYWPTSTSRAINTRDTNSATHLEDNEKKRVLERLDVPIQKDMDLSDALFSPSKARQQQAQAKDWIFVDSWLSKKYHPKPVPSFERNEETLQALMTLVAFNERADEEQTLVDKVERQALNDLEEKVGLLLSCLYC